ncbi:MAG: PorT family protein [Bacteroidetes bacterium]|nr:PorT family protein [Bacteroidota bacterium]
MQELPDDRLDELFRKSSEEFEPTFDPKAWEAMRRKLDDEDTKPGAWWWRRAGVIGGIVLLLGLGSYWFWPNTSKIQAVSTEIETKTVVPQPNAPKVSEPSQSKKIADEINVSETQKNNLEAAQEETPALDERPRLALEKKEKEQLTQIQQTKKQSVASIKERSGAVGATREKSLALKNTREPVLKQTEEDGQTTRWVKDSKNKRVTTAKVSSTFPPQASSNEPQGLTNFNITLNELVAKNWKLLAVSVAEPTVAYLPPAPPPVVKKKESAEPPTAFRKGLSTRVVATPDLSFISSSEMLKNPRLALGMMLEYRFARRWSVQLGVIKSDKVYTATGEQYKWPEIWNSQKARPTEVAANCKVLDIPINIRFDVLEGRRSRWFVSSGVSSYKMMNERYDYTYPLHSYPKWMNWEGSTGSYWLGVLNASVGVERQIGRNFSLQVEPFWKIPMAEVGFGKIRLQTSGIFISAKYRLSRTGF